MIERSDQIIRDYIEMHWDLDDGETISPEWLQDVTEEFAEDYEKQFGVRSIPGELIQVSGLEGGTGETLSEMLERLGYTDAAGDLLDVPRRVAQPRLPVSADALDAINRHRRAVGQAQLDPTAAGWSALDVELEAKRIAQLNPDMAALKRRLML